MILRQAPGARAPKRLQENNLAEDGQIVTTAPNIGRVSVSSFGTDGWNRSGQHQTMTSILVEREYLARVLGDEDMPAKSATRIEPNGVPDNLRRELVAGKRDRHALS